MEPSAISNPPDASGAGAIVAAERHEQCDECGVAVERAQRYCVNCGARRRHVDDPAARYLSHTTAKARADQSVARRSASRGRRSPGLGSALVVAVIPLAVALGVL